MHSVSLAGLWASSYSQLDSAKKLCSIQSAVFALCTECERFHNGKCLSSWLTTANANEETATPEGRSQLQNRNRHGNSVSTCVGEAATPF